MIFLITVSATATDGPGLDGPTRWGVEAATERQALEMVRRRVGEVGTLAAKPVTDIARYPELAVLGLTTAIVPLGPDAGDTGVSREMSIAPLHAPDKGDLGWLPSGLRPCLLDRGDGVRAYMIVPSAIWEGQADENGAPPSLSLAHPDVADAFLAGTMPVLVDVTLTQTGTWPPTAFHGVLPVLGDKMPLILRTSQDIGTFRDVLRRLVMVRDVDGRRYFNRFWEPEFFLYFVLFLEGRGLLAPLAEVTEFAACIEGEIVRGALDLAACRTAPADPSGDLDRLFGAGAAMVALRHIRKVEAEFAAGCDPDAIYAMARRLFDLKRMDYFGVQACMELCYAAHAIYRDAPERYLSSGRADTCMDEGGLTMEFHDLHGRSMFGLRQDVLPHLLHPDLELV